MLETKEQKQIFAGTIALVVVLAVVSFWQHPGVQYHDTNNYSVLAQKSQKEQQAYADYLASLNTTPAEQQAAFSQILPKAEIQAQVEQELDATQTVEFPKVLDSQIKISSASGKNALQNYLAQSAPLFAQLQDVTNSGASDIYNPDGDVNKIDSMLADASAALSSYKKIPVPQEAADFHKQLIAGLETYIDLLKNSKTYMANASSDPWPNVYKDYSIIAQVNTTAGGEFNQLNKKYNLLGDSTPSANGNWLVPKASAQIATIDIWQKAQQALEQAAAESVAQFMLSFMNKLATKIEQSYRISNFLYYSDALVSGQYVDDYLNKYVSDPLDRTIAKNFIPQISCGSTGNNNQAFQAKANQYLGFDPSTLNPNDPQFYQKMAKTGDFFSSSQGWQVYYQGLADQAQSAAQNAANQEILSSGQKAGRGPSGDVITPSQVSSEAMAAIFQRYADEGSDTGGFAAVQQITSQIAQNFLNNFVLQGVVLLEQKTCIAVPQAQLVTAIPN